VRRCNKLVGYKPLTWESDSQLSKHEQEMVEIQRKDLWQHGIRKQPMLDRMAFEFAAVVCILQSAE